MTASFAVHMSGHVSSSRRRPDRHADARGPDDGSRPVRRPGVRCRAASAPRRPEGACGAGRLATDGRSQAQGRAQFIITVVSLMSVPEGPSYPQLIVTASRDVFMGSAAQPGETDNPKNPGAPPRPRYRSKIRESADACGKVTSRRVARGPIPESMCRSCRRRSPGGR
jgi:hypothetical protein